jgi:protein PhnA
MNLSKSLSDRNQNKCELCHENIALHGYAVSPRKDEIPQNQVAICDKCYGDMDVLSQLNHWRCLEGSIWSQEPPVQALSYRLLQRLSNQPWAQDVLSSVAPGDEITEWASYKADAAGHHVDGFGNVLSHGDNVVLTQALEVRGSNFTASKGTVVKRIRLVSDNPEQIEGKINEQQIVILTKDVRKN